MAFLYEKSNRSRGKQGLLITLLIGLFFGAIVYYLVAIDTAPIGHQVGRWFAWLLAFMLSLACLWSLRMLLSSDGWRIEITEQQLLWQPPAGSTVTQVQLPLSDIARLRYQNADHPHLGLLLTTRSGEELLLLPFDSGVNLNAFIDALQSHGIDCQDH